MNYLQNSLQSVVLTLASMVANTNSNTCESYKIDWIGTHAISKINEHQKDNSCIKSIEIKINYIDRKADSYYFLNSLNKDCG